MLLVVAGPPNGFGLEDPLSAEKNLDGAGVELGVVEPNKDLGFSCSAGVATSMLSSFDSLEPAALEAESSRERPNPPRPKPPLPLGFSLSLAEAGSALNVVPSTNGDEPKAPPSLGFEPGAGNAVLLFEGCDPNAPVPVDCAKGLLPLPKGLWLPDEVPNGEEAGLEKMLPPLLSPLRLANPLWPASPAKPLPIVGPLEAAPLPKTFPLAEPPVEGAAALEKP